MRREVAELRALVEQLQARLQRNSSKSSRPPSSDAPAAPRPPAPRGPAGRRPGGQPGHPGAARKLKPLEALADTFDEVPATCQHCRAPFSPDAGEDAPPPLRHQVTELAPVLVRTVECRLHSRHCRCCRRFTRAALPAGVPSGVIGPRFQAWCALLSGRFRLSRRGVQELVACGLGEELSPGSRCSLEGATAAALAAPYTEVAAAVGAAPAVNADETPWRQGKERATLWLAATRQLALFRIDAHRDRAAFDRLLPPDVARTVTADRYSVYQHLVGDGWEICWAHLDRDFKALADRRGAVQSLGEADRREIARLFGLWHRFRTGEFDRRTLRARLRPIQARFKTVLRKAKASRDYDAPPLARNLLRKWPSLRTFARVEGVEPTNNHAERALRHAVLWRRSSFGNQSEGGRQFVERMLTAVSSLRLQGRPVLDYLEAVCRAARGGNPAPSLLPAAPR